MNFKESKIKTDFVYCGRSRCCTSSSSFSSLRTTMIAVTTICLCYYLHKSMYVVKYTATGPFTLWRLLLVLCCLADGSCKLVLNRIHSAFHHTRDWGPLGTYFGGWSCSSSTILLSIVYENELDTSHFPEFYAFVFFFGHLPVSQFSLLGERKFLQSFNVFLQKLRPMLPINEQD